MYKGTFWTFNRRRRYIPPEIVLGLESGHRPGALLSSRAVSRLESSSNVGGLKDACSGPRISFTWPFSYFDGAGEAHTGELSPLPTPAGLHEVKQYAACTVRCGSRLASV